MDIDNIDKEVRDIDKKLREKSRELTELANTFEAFNKQPKIDWPDPTPEMLETPRFNAVWECIKTWDINVPGAYAGYTTATGNHVRAILDALAKVESLLPCGHSAVNVEAGACGVKGCVNQHQME
jgi:hypothetical protein